MIAPLVATTLLAGAPPCLSQDVRSFNAMLQGATGTMDGAVYVRSVASVRCMLGGRPRVRIATRSGIVLRTSERTFALADAGGHRVTTLAPRGKAILHLDWSNWCGAWPVPTTQFRVLYLRVVTTAGARLSFPIRTGRPRCDAPGRPSVLYVSPFATIV